MKMEIMERIFGWLRPASLRTRPKQNEDLNDATMGRLQDYDPVYRALTDHAHNNFQDAVMEALQSGMTDSERQYRCGVAAGLLNYLTAIERWRLGAKEHNAKEAARKLNRS